MEKDHPAILTIKFILVLASMASFVTAGTLVHEALGWFVAGICLSMLLRAMAAKTYAHRSKKGHTVSDGFRPSDDYSEAERSSYPKRNRTN